MVINMKKRALWKSKIRAKLYPVFSRFSMKTQLIALVSITFTLIIAVIITYNYRSNRNAITVQQTQSASTLLNLESQNLDAYFTEISRYSLLLRHDASFIQSISSSTALDYAEKSNIQSLLRSNFDSRTDLISYRLFLLNKADNYMIDSKRHKVQTFYDNYVTELPGYDTFTQKPYYRSIEPANEEGTFITYYRTIIRIEDQKPLAIVELTFDTSYIDSIAQDHNDLGELFCMVDEQNRILYTNTPDIDAAFIQQALPSLSDTSVNNFHLTSKDVSYLGVYHTSEAHGYKIISFKPLSGLDQKIAATRNVSLLIAILAIVIAIVLVSFFIRLITNPLSTLAHRLRRVGTGNFTTTTDIGGSLEITNLAHDFNSMIHHIDDLIKKNYISEINAKTSRLIALEAQLNPHFLYNTLQAISAEAIINKQPKINAMVTSLASMLRYSIKEEYFVSVAQEIKHVNDYLSLQHSRFGENLTYEWNIDEDTLHAMIPKISIQTLVENSITHGISGDIDHINIYIRTYMEGDQLLIKVRDDGIGIAPEKLNELKEAFANSDLNTHKSLGIGLMNLSSRIHILYDEPASLSIESNLGYYTLVTLSIPTGGNLHVSRTHN
ncbi:MAG: histidine kinase [Lachnospiraceae bacterium]|nr:histidine kinase [Lachnospiraceae bacterium]